MGLVCLTAGCGPTQEQAAQAPEPSPQAQAERLAEAHGFDLREVKMVEKAGAKGSRHELHFDGVPVWGLEAKTAQGKTRLANMRLEPGTRADTKPRISQAEAELAVLEALKQPSAVVTDARLMLLPHEERRRRPDAPASVAPNAVHYERVVTGFTLLYRLLLSVQEEGFPEASPWLAQVDAHSGQVLRVEPLERHNTFQPVTGRSHFSGSQQLLVPFDPNVNEYYLEDSHGNTYQGMEYAGTKFSTFHYSSTDASFGDARPYNPLLGPRSQNAETAAVDAFFGVNLTWRVFSAVLNRNGPNGTGRPLKVFVHAKIANAQYKPDVTGKSPTLWIGYTTGQTIPRPNATLLPMASVDIIAHEVGHDFFATEITTLLPSPSPSASALETYSEMAGMDEATGDIIAFITEMARDVATTQRPLPDLDRMPPQEHHFQLGEQTGVVIRNLLRPDWPEWGPEIIYQVPHTIAGPIDRMFVLLAYGCQPVSTTGVDPAWTCRLVPKGFTGVGPLTAVRLWAKTVEALPPLGDIAQARDVALDVARQFDAARNDGAHFRAVASAFAAVNVGDAPDTTPPNVTLACKRVGMNIECTGTMVDADSNFSIHNAPDISLDGGTPHKLVPSTAPFTHMFPGASLASGDHTIRLRAWDGWENLATQSVTVFFDKAGPQASVARSGPPKQPVLTVSATDPSGISRVEFLEGTQLLKTVTGAPYTATFDTSTWTDGTRTLVIKAYDTFDNVSVLQYELAADNTRPVVTMTVGTAGPPFSINATATDGSTLVRADFKVDGNVFTTRTTGSPYFATYVPSGPGASQLTVEVTDAFGNTGVATAAAPRDQTPPAVVFSAQQRLTGEMALTVETADPCGIQYPYGLYVDGLLVGQSSTPGYVVLLAASAVSVGPHAFHAIVHDRCGNTTTYQTVFSKVFTPPGIIVTRDDSQPKKPKFTVTCNDFEGVHRAEMFEAGYPLRKDETAPYEFVVDTTARVNGDSQVEFRCIDIYGAWSSNEVFTVTADNTGPSISGFTVYGSGTAYQVTAGNVSDPRGIKSVVLQGGFFYPYFNITLMQPPWFYNLVFASTAHINGLQPFWVTATDKWGNETMKSYLCHMDTNTTVHHFLACQSQT